MRFSYRLRREEGSDRRSGKERRFRPEGRLSLDPKYMYVPDRRSGKDRRSGGERRWSRAGRRHLLDLDKESI